MVKLFGCSVDSELIKNMNPAQMLWYSFMLNDDRKNKFEAKRDMTEYLASFINYEAVIKTKESRETRKVVSDDDFDQQLRQQFGRDLHPSSFATAIRAADIQEKPKTIIKKKGSISIEDIKKYAEMELDDVKFHPKK